MRNIDFTETEPAGAAARGRAVDPRQCRDQAFASEAIRDVALSGLAVWVMVLGVMIVFS
ncbi:MAG: hypothetical protein ACFCUO_06875 [Rhodospirillales bacterium]